MQPNKTKQNRLTWWFSLTKGANCMSYLFVKQVKGYDLTEIFITSITSHIGQTYISLLTFTIHIYYIIKLTIGFLHSNKIVLNIFNISYPKLMSPYFIYIVSAIFFSKLRLSYAFASTTIDKKMFTNLIPAWSLSSNPNPITKA